VNYYSRTLNTRQYIRQSAVLLRAVWLNVVALDLSDKIVVGFPFKVMVPRNLNASKVELTSSL
jgi:hypothetical protein